MTERMLGLLAALQGGRAFTGDELAARLGVSPRTLRRDVERLRGYGYPVRTRPGPGGHYRLAAGRRMPPLVLDDDEAVAVVAGLATLSANADEAGALAAAATRAYGKIDAVLPDRLRPRAAALRASIEAESRPAPPVAAGTLGDLADAIAEREIVAFDYVDAAGTASRRRVEAHRQVTIDGRWYLMCWDLARDDWRVFRTDRITNLLRTGARYGDRPLPAESALAYLRSGLGDRGRA